MEVDPSEIAGSEGEWMISRPAARCQKTSPSLIGYQKKKAAAKPTDIEAMSFRFSITPKQPLSAGINLHTNPHPPFQARGAPRGTAERKRARN
jgi:hypothetical protein